MEIGVTVRLMGESATREIVARCARRAEQAGLDAVWLPDHIAIPPDDAEGSNGRYLDVLASLAWLAGITERIALGAGVLVLPYRPALPTAKWIATIQELSAGRLRIGAGVGWMDAEFRALGLDRAHRGRDADAVLELLHTCFEAPDDVATANGQDFLFRPRPARPRILIGGNGAHAIDRAVRLGDGWMPMLSDPGKLEAPVRALRERFAAAGKAPPEVVVHSSIPEGSVQAGVDHLATLAEVGVTGFIQGLRYTTADEFAAGIEPAARVREALAGVG
jgi:probable F420-dependent oxidoreductase